MRLRSLAPAVAAVLALALGTPSPGSPGRPALPAADALEVVAARRPLVVVPDDYADVAAAVAALPAGGTGGTVYVRARQACYPVHRMIHLDRSNLSLVGEEGACLRLGDHVNRPVILVGSASPTVAPEERIHDVAVRGFRVDGNRSNQDQEGAVGLPNVQNNAIGVRGAERVHLERLTLTGARSGGLVISQQARKVFVRDVTFSDNQFDGLAVDGAHDVLVEQFVAEDNLFSGISVDTGSSGLQVRDGVTRRNGDNGVFIRHARESSFTDLTITDNCNLGVFASHAGADGSEGLVEITFSGLRIFRNRDAGFFFGTAPFAGSADNFLTHSLIGGNGAPGTAGELQGTDANPAITLVGNAVVPLRADGPTNRSCGP